MKKLMNNIFTSTGITLVLLAIIATLSGGTCIFISSVFESLLVNILIFTGLKFLQKKESKYFLLTIIRDITFTLTILIPAGFLFHWYKSTPIWIIVLMSIIIYIVSCLVHISQIYKDVNFINEQLKK